MENKEEFVAAAKIGPLCVAFDIQESLGKKQELALNKFFLEILRFVKNNLPW